MDDLENIIMPKLSSDFKQNFNISEKDILSTSDFVLNITKTDNDYKLQIIDEDYVDISSALFNLGIYNENKYYFYDDKRIPKNILLHSCCAPCSIFPITDLRIHDIEPYLYFYNPNIHTKEELQKRADGLSYYADKYDLEYEIDTYCAEDLWRSFSTDKKNKHCDICYGMRMQQVAKLTRQLGLEGFTTSLLISPYQNHDKIHKIAMRMADKYGVKYYPFDFRPGFYQSQKMAKEEGIYRQKFCGCIYSISESFYAKKIARSLNLNLEDLPLRKA